MSCKFIIVLTCYSTFISVFREKWENMKLLVHFKRYQWWCLLLIYLCRHKGNQEMCHLQRVWFILPFIITLCSEGEDHSLNLWFQHQTFALWSACNVGIANIAKRERNKGAKQLDALMKVSPWCCALLTQFIHFGYWETLCLSGTFSTTENIHWKLP